MQALLIEQNSELQAAGGRQVSLVQPVSSMGLVSLAVLQHFWLQERLTGGEWGAVALAVAGTVGLGATTEGAPPAAAAAVSPLRMAALSALTVMAIGTRIVSSPSGPMRISHMGFQQFSEGATAMDVNAP